MNGVSILSLYFPSLSLSLSSLVRVAACWSDLPVAHSCDSRLAVRAAVRMTQLETLDGQHLSTHTHTTRNTAKKKQSMRSCKKASQSLWQIGLSFAAENKFILLCVPLTFFPALAR